MQEGITGDVQVHTIFITHSLLQQSNMGAHGTGLRHVTTEYGVHLMMLCRELNPLTIQQGLGTAADMHHAPIIFYLHAHLLMK